MNEKLKSELRFIALQSGFTLKQQKDGEYDLNDYVYKFGEKIINKYGDIDLRDQYQRFLRRNNHKWIVLVFIQAILIGYLGYSNTTLRNQAKEWQSLSYFKDMQLQKIELNRPQDPHKYCPAWFFASKDLIASRNRMCGKRNG